jgi:[ribosomal protein S18]-alanine N-acetyltransferase
MEIEASAVTAAHWSEQQYQAALSQSEPQRLVLVIEDGPRLQGFLVAREVDADWEIENAVVAESSRRCGLGTSLLVEFLNITRARGAKEIFLEARESNLAARQLYQKQGFAESGRRGGYYHLPEEDAIMYRLNFSCCTAGGAGTSGTTPK